MSALYNSGRNSFLKGEIDWVGDTIKAAAIDTSQYTVDLTTHNFFDDISGGAVVDTVALSTKTATNGVADCDDILFESITGNTISALVIYVDTGTSSTSNLIAYIDAGPVDPNGSDITFLVDSGPNKLFKL